MTEDQKALFLLVYIGFVLGVVDYYRWWFTCHPEDWEWLRTEWEHLVTYNRKYDTWAPGTDGLRRSGGFTSGRKEHSDTMIGAGGVTVPGRTTAEHLEETGGVDVGPLHQQLGAVHGSTLVENRS